MIVFQAKKTLGTCICSEKQERKTAMIYFKDSDNKIVIIPCWKSLYIKNFNNDIEYDTEYFLSNFFDIIDDYYKSLSSISIEDYCSGCPRYNTVHYDYQNNFFKVIIFDIVRKCNVHCKFCYMDFEHSDIEKQERIQKKLMDIIINNKDKSEKLFDYFIPELSSEPFLDQYVIDMISENNWLAEKSDVFSNFSIADKYRIDKLNKNIHLRASICSPFKEEYERNCGKIFDKVIENALYANSVNKLKCIESIILDGQTFNNNIDEYIEQYKKLGFKNLRINFNLKNDIKNEEIKKYADI